MSAISKGRKDIKFIISQARGLMELDEELERVGGLEKLEREIASRVDALKSEADGLAAKIAACDVECKARRDEAAGIVQSAHRDADAIAQRAEADDDAAKRERAGLKLAAEAEIVETMRVAGLALSDVRKSKQEIDGQVAEATARRDALNAEAGAAIARRDAANAEVERLQKLFGKAS